MSEISTRPRAVATLSAMILIFVTLAFTAPNARAASTVASAEDVSVRVTVTKDSGVAEKGLIEDAIAAAKWLAGKLGIGGDSGGGKSGGSNENCNVNVNITIGGSGAPPQNVQVNVGNATCGKGNNGGDSSSGNNKQ